MLVIGKTQKLWNGICYWVALLLVSAETPKTTASLIPRASEPGEKKMRKKVIKQLLLKWLFLEYSMQWCSWGQRQEREIHPLPIWADLDHLSSFEIKYRAGGFMYIYCATAPLISWLTGPLLVAGSAERTSSDYKMSVWQQISESWGSSCPHHESSLPALEHVTDSVCKLTTQKRQHKLLSKHFGHGNVNFNLPWRHVLSQVSCSK